MTLKHTKTPWVLAADGLTVKESIESIEAQGGNLGGFEHFPFEIARVVDGSRTDRANAAFIVLSANAHAGMFAALSQIAEADHPDYPYFTRGTEAEFAQHLIGIARAAVARVCELRDRPVPGDLDATGDEDGACPDAAGPSN